MSDSGKGDKSWEERALRPSPRWNMGLHQDEDSDDNERPVAPQPDQPEQPEQPEQTYSQAEDLQLARRRMQIVTEMRGIFERYRAATAAADERLIARISDMTLLSSTDEDSGEASDEASSEGSDGDESEISIPANGILRQVLREREAAPRHPTTAPLLPRSLELNGPEPEPEPELIPTERHEDHGLASNLERREIVAEQDVEYERLLEEDRRRKEDEEERERLEMALELQREDRIRTAEEKLPAEPDEDGLEEWVLLHIHSPTGEILERRFRADDLGAAIYLYLESRGIFEETVVVETSQKQELVPHQTLRSNGLSGRFALWARSRR